MAAAAGTSGSQTLSRGLRVLEVLAEATGPLPLPELCRRLELHRSIVYRLLRTLEEHGLVVRDADGRVRLGAGLAALSRSVERDLQASALPELTRIANEANMTAFLTVLVDDAVVTLLSVEPHRGGGIVAQRPGSRHLLDVGAPGSAIRAQLAPEALARLGVEHPPALTTPRGAQYAVSRDEVIPGLASVAVPLVVTGEPPAALAVVHVSGAAFGVEEVADLLHDAAETVAADLT